MKKIGMLTIGQSPRSDVISEIQSICMQEHTYIERGILDQYNYEEVASKFAPNDDSVVLVTKMKDGRQIRLCREKIHGLIQECITELEKQGCDVIVLLCTGKFPDFKHSVPLFNPCNLLRSITSELVVNGPIGVIISEESQIETFKEYWTSRNIKTIFVAASPYNDVSKVLEAAKKLEEANVTMIFLHSIGFSLEMKHQIRNVTGRPVLCSRTMVGRILEDI